MLYARSLDRQSTFGFAGLSLETAGNQQTLALIAAVTVGLFALAGGLNYVGDRLSMRVDRRQHERGVALVFATVAHIPPSRWIESQLTPDELITRLQADARIVGRVSRMVVRSLMHVAVCASAFVGLVVIDIGLTVIVCVASLVAGAGLYIVNVKAANSTRRGELRARPSARRRRDLVDVIRSGTPITHDEIDAEVRAALGGYLDAYYGRYLGLDQSSLLIQLFTGVAFAAILLTEGLQLIDSDSGLEELLVYVVALRYFLRSASRVTRVATSINRYYSQLRRFQVFASSAAADVPPVQWPIRVDAESLETGERKLLECNEGSVVHLIAPGRIDRFQLARWLSPVATSDGRRAETWLVAVGETGVRGELMEAARTRPEPLIGVLAEHLAEQTMKDGVSIAGHVAVVVHGWPAHFEALGDAVLVAVGERIMTASSCWIRENPDRIDGLFAGARPVRAQRFGDEDDESEFDDLDDF